MSRERNLRNLELGDLTVAELWSAAFCALYLAHHPNALPSTAVELARVCWRELNAFRQVEHEPADPEAARKVRAARALRDALTAGASAGVPGDPSLVVEAFQRAFGAPLIESGVLDRRTRDAAASLGVELPAVRPSGAVRMVGLEEPPTGRQDEPAASLPRYEARALRDALAAGASDLTPFVLAFQRAFGARFGAPLVESGVLDARTRDAAASLGVELPMPATDLPDPENK